MGGNSYRITGNATYSGEKLQQDTETITEENNKM